MRKICRDGDIAIIAVDEPVEVRMGARLIARTAKAFGLHESRYPVRYYLPREDVEPGLLVPSAHKTSCPFKGEASYYHLRLGGETRDNAVWSYEDPCPQVAQIGGMLSFWGDAISVRPVA